MPQSLARVAIHIVFGTKHRRPWLDDVSLSEELYAYMATVLKANDSPAVVIGGAADHVHTLCVLSRKVTIAKLVEEMKTGPSKWIKTKGPEFRDFHWQAGYGVFSVSESKLIDVRRYIESQRQHHERMTFQDEYRQLCERHGLPVDERYAWD